MVLEAIVIILVLIVLMLLVVVCATGKDDKHSNRQSITKWKTQGDKTKTSNIRADHYIIVTKAKHCADALRKKHKLDSNHQYNSKACHAKMSSVELEKFKVAAKDSIKRIEPDLILQRCVNWNIDRINVCSAPGNLCTGGLLNKIPIYIIDTGVKKRDGLNVVEQLDFTGDGSVDDGNGHGTHCAGIAAAFGSELIGVCPGAPIHSYRALDDGGSGSLSNVAAAVQDVMNKNPNGKVVISLSLGTPADSSYNFLDDLLAAAVNQGIAVVTASGNEGDLALNFSPGHGELMLNVGSINQSNQASSFSNYGSRVRTYAPGENIVSFLNAPSDLVSMSGTSMACPHVAGWVAAMWNFNPSLTVSQLRSMLNTYQQSIVQHNLLHSTHQLVSMTSN